MRRSPSESSSGVLLWCALALVTLPTSAVADGTLSDNWRVASETLGYDFQVRVYTPDGPVRTLPTLYVADGQWYIEPGGLVGVLDSMIASGAIDPVQVVFIDSRNPRRLSENRRNSEFFCNPGFVHFVANELVAAVEERYDVSSRRADRAILGLSFGGLNGACFGVMAQDVFGALALQSPAMHPVPDIYERFARAEGLDLRIFLSTGTVGDNQDQALRLRRVLQSRRDVELEYVEVDAGHDWSNWRPLLDDVLRFLYGREGTPSGSGGKVDG